MTKPPWLSLPHAHLALPSLCSEKSTQAGPVLLKQLPKQKMYAQPVQLSHSLLTDLSSLTFVWNLLVFHLPGAS